MVHSSRGRCFTVPSLNVQSTPVPKAWPELFFAKEIGAEKMKQAMIKDVIFFMISPLS